MPHNAKARVRHLASLAALVLISAGTSPVWAEVVTWRASGTVDGITNMFGVLPIAAAVGDPFSIDVTFDTATPCGAACSSSTYRYYYPISLMKVTIAGQSFVIVPSSDPYNNFFTVEKANPIAEGGYRDRYIFRGEAGATSGIQYIADVSMGTDGATPPSTPIMGLDIPSAPVDPNAFAVARIAFAASSPESRLEQRSDNVVGDMAAFTVVLTTPEDRLAALLEAVTDLGPGKSLANKIMHAQAYYAAADLASTCAMLTGFMNEVAAQTGKKIEPPEAEALSADAKEIMEQIDCQ